MDLRLDRGGLNLIRDSLGYATSESSSSFSEGSIHVQAGSLEQLHRAHIPEGTCPVCMEEKNNVLLLPCQHQFHADCILKWTERRFACPLCRTEISHFVPLSQMKSEVATAMNHAWEQHYVTTVQPAREPEVPKYACKLTQAKSSFSRCSPQAQVREPSPPRPTKTCKMCTDSLDNDYIYMAFDFQFCSSQCRLKYARANKPQRDEVDGTTSFYVDHSQLEKFFRTPPKVPKAQDMSSV